MRSDCYFVTGTDTGIGKTVVSATLAVGLKSRYWKPIQTGSSEETDSQFVSRWISRARVSRESYVFPESVSPHLAAEMNGCKIELRTCVDAFLSFSEPTVVEGAGGALVPINSSDKMADLIGKLNIPAIVVAGTKLGTINHTLLTLEALRAREILVAGVVTVGDENLATSKSIESYGHAPILGHVPWCSSFSLSWFQQTYQNFQF